MEYRRLGKSGLKVSELSLGSWVTFSKQVDEKEAMALMSLAYDEGVNFFDNAEGYEAGESEALMGAALKKLAWSRDSYSPSPPRSSGAAPSRRRRACRASTSPKPRTPRSSGCRSTISISTSATAPTSILRSRKPSGRCTISSPRARCSIGARPSGMPSSSPRPGPSRGPTTSSPPTDGAAAIQPVRAAKRSEHDYLPLYDLHGSGHHDLVAPGFRRS
jgi:hypothetical protein